MEEYFKADSYLRDKNTEFVATRTPDVVIINLGTNDQMKGIDIQKQKW
jgi:lysophospholipase L1-like esterase